MVSLTGSGAFHQSHAGFDANRITNGARKMIQSGRKNSYRTREIMEGCIHRQIDLTPENWIRTRIPSNLLPLPWRSVEIDVEKREEEKAKKRGEGKRKKTKDLSRFVKKLWNRLLLWNVRAIDLSRSFQNRSNALPMAVKGRHAIRIRKSASVLFSNHSLLAVN